MISPNVNSVKLLLYGLLVDDTGISQNPFVVGVPVAEYDLMLTSVPSVCALSSLTIIEFVVVFSE